MSNTSPPAAVGLAGLQTEARNPRTGEIDRLSTFDLCRLLNREDARVAAAVESSVPIIAQVVDLLSHRVRNGGRVFYIGAGTSGRLGVLDASEVPPTYSAHADTFIALIAGGDRALRQAQEGAEDDRSAAEEQLRALSFRPELDSLVGIASSGRTPYVLGGLAYARSMRAATIGIVCVQPSAVADEGNTDFLITAVTGPEAVTGSTRMKAGTATKLILNMISTGVMIRLGKTYGNLMIDLKATNVKLRQRARNMLRLIADPAGSRSDEELDAILDDCRGSVKLAVASTVLGKAVPDVEKLLEENGGFLAPVLMPPPQDETDSEDDLVLCVDAGGTSCKAVILANGTAAVHGIAGPCNVSNQGLDAAVTSISQAIQAALDKCKGGRSRRLEFVKFSAAFVGVAGYDRPALRQTLDDALSSVVKLSAGRVVKVMADIDLVPVSVPTDADQLDWVIALVAGTGSVAMSYRKLQGCWRRTGRAGGWGPFLGDDGGGYGVGRAALRICLHAFDSLHMGKDHVDDDNDGDDTPQAGMQTLSPLVHAVTQHLEAQSPGRATGDLLSAVLVPEGGLERGEDATGGAIGRIASVAQPVLSTAAAGDEEAMRLIESGAQSLARLVGQLARREGIEPQRCGIVMTGGMMQSSLYRRRLIDAVEKQLGKFGHLQVVEQPALEGARLLRRLVDSRQPGGEKEAKVEEALQS